MGRHAEPFQNLGCGLPCRDVRGGAGCRGRRPRALGPLRVRGGARSRTRPRSDDGRADRGVAARPRAARLGAGNRAAPPDTDDRRVGNGAPALRLDAGADGLRGRAPAHARSTGQVPRPCGPVPASKGSGADRLGVGRTEGAEEMRAARVLAGIVSALVARGGGLAAQQKPAAGQPPQLQVSLAEAVRRALDVQPAMVRARGDATNAGWQKRGAVGAFLPTVLFSSSAFRQNTESNVNGFLASAGTYQFNTGLSASVDLFTGFRRLATYRNADATQDAADAEVVNQRYLVSAATAQLFYTSLANEELVRVAEAQLERAKEELQISVNKFQAGAATRSDTLTATVDLGNARLALLQAQANLATAQANLARQIGVDGVVRAVPDSQLPPVPDTTELRTAALRQAPVVMQAAASERATAATLWSNRSQYLPKLTASYNTSSQGLNEPWQGFDGGNRNLNRLSFALSWTVFDGFQREKTTASSVVDLDNARAQTADTRRQLGADLTQQFAAMSTAFAKIEITGANVVAAAEARRVTQERYRLGAGTLLDLLTAQANQTQAEVNQVQARYDYLIARAQVEALVGPPLWPPLSRPRSAPATRRCPTPSSSRTSSRATTTWAARWGTRCPPSGPRCHAQR